MTLRQIVWGNLKRRKGRAFFLILGFAIGIGTVVALHSLSQAIQMDIGHQLDQFGANIVIVPKAGTLALDYGGVSVSGVSFDVGRLETGDLESIKSIPYQNRLSAVAPKLIAATTIEGRETLLVGVRFTEELSMKKWWRLWGRIPAGPDEIILGSEIARQLGVIGETQPVAVMPAGNHEHAAMNPIGPLLRTEVTIREQPFQVAGVLGETGGRDDQMVFASLERVQAMMGKPAELSLVEVSALCKDCPIDDIVAQLQSKLPLARVSAVQQAVRARTVTVERLNRFSAGLGLIVLVIGGLMITSTLTASVVERTGEIGVLRAVGYRKRHILELLIMEVSLLSLAGGVVGWLSGTAASALAVRYFTDATVGPAPSLELAAASVGVAMALGVIGAILPARRAAALDPTEALRRL